MSLQVVPPKLISRIFTVLSAVFLILMILGVVEFIIYIIFWMWIPIPDWVLKVIVTQVIGSFLLSIITMIFSD